MLLPWQRRPPPAVQCSPLPAHSYSSRALFGTLDHPRKVTVTDDRCTCGPHGPPVREGTLPSARISELRARQADAERSSGLGLFSPVQDCSRLGLAWLDLQPVPRTLPSSVHQGALGLVDGLVGYGGPQGKPFMADLVTVWTSRFLLKPRVGALGEEARPLFPFLPRPHSSRGPRQCSGAPCGLDGDPLSGMCEGSGQPLPGLGLSRRHTHTSLGGMRDQAPG